MVSYIFPADALRGSSWRVDDHFSREYASAQLTAPVALVDSYSLGDRVLMSLPEGFSSPVVYRGWMLSEGEYRVLHSALAQRGFTMLTSPEEYIRAHTMEGWIGEFAGLTPPTVIISSSASDEELLEAAGRIPQDQGYFLKGSVKSEPGYSYAKTIEDLPRIAADFRTFSGIGSDENLAIRSFERLSGSMAELRTWWINGWMVLIDVHPSFHGTMLDDPLDWDSLSNSAIDFTAKLRPHILDLKSPFVTADIALTASEEWILVEVGDGQVSGLPQGYNKDELNYSYERFAEEFSSEPSGE